MPDQKYVKDFFNSLIGDDSWLREYLVNPRLANHGADPWCIDIDISTTPIIFSFKFRRRVLSCCIILRRRQSADDFEEVIKKLYGQHFEKVGVDIAGKGNEVYFKPFGTEGNFRTRDVFFEVGTPPNLEKRATVDPCHEMPKGGRIALRDAVIQVLRHMGFGPGQQNQVIPTVDGPVVGPAAAPVGGKPQRSTDTTTPLSPEIPFQPAPVRETQSRPLVNQIMHFMHDHCTGSGAAKAENQKKFVSELRKLLDLTTLRPRHEDELWRLMWDKPIYANQNNNTATKVIQRCRDNKVFDNLRNIPYDVPGRVRILDGLQHPVEKLERIRGLSQKFQQIYGLYNAALQALQNPANQHLAQNSQADDFDSIRILIGALPQQGRRRVGIYPVVNSIRGFGGITELHMLVDFGFPVCKPDLWIVRTVIAFLNIHNSSRPDLVEFIHQKHPEFKLADLTQEFLNRRHHYSFRVLDYIVRYELDFTDPFFKANGIDPEIRFRGHRLADLIVAKFGMKAEERFGLVCSPMDRLNLDRSLVEHYPELALLAAKIRNYRK